MCGRSLGPLCVLQYLVGVHEVGDQVQVTVDGLILTELGLHSVQPVHQRLQGLRKLAREQEGLRQFVLSGERRGREEREEESVEEGWREEEKVMWRSKRGRGQKAQKKKMCTFSVDRVGR